MKEDDFMIKFNFVPYQKKIVTLQCGSQRTPLLMNPFLYFKSPINHPMVFNWGFLENWKSTASDK